jgi:hypothetical protein
MARTAAVAGTATAVSNRVSRRQAAPAPDPIEQLKQLGELHQQGILTDEEFAAQKAKLLGG